MALQQPTIGHRIAAHRDALHVLLIFAAAAAVFALMLVIGAFLVSPDPAPVFPFLADPAGSIPF
jgi:hypothetical protein